MTIIAIVSVGHGYVAGMVCSVCNRRVERKETITCVACHHGYHLKCGNIALEDYREHAEQLKKTWKCATCVKSTRRIRSDDTPIRPAAITALDKPGVSHDGSFEGTQQNLENNMPLTCMTSEKISGESGSLGYADFGKLLDSRLSVIEASITKNIIANIKDTIKNEIGTAVKQLQDEFTHTTDFLSAEQKDLKNTINTTNEKVKTLETEKAQLQRDLADMGSRLRALEKVSRSCNAELHCIHENKQEDLLGVMRKISDKIGNPVLGQNISSIRRVAKVSPATDRPRNILVTFTSQSSRDSLITAYKEYNKAHKEDPINTDLLGISGRKQRIYIVEHLSPETKKLHVATKEKLKNSYKYIWIKYGRVYVRKNENSDAIHVSDLSGLLKLD